MIGKYWVPVTDRVAISGTPQVGHVPHAAAATSARHGLTNSRPRLARAHVGTPSPAPARSNPSNQVNYSEGYSKTILDQSGQVPIVPKSDEN